MDNYPRIIKRPKVWYMKCWHCDLWQDKTTMIDHLCDNCFNKLDKNGCYGSVED